LLQSLLQDQKKLVAKEQNITNTERGGFTYVIYSRAR
jgi:hypothetical protein